MRLQVSPRFKLLPLLVTLASLHLMAWALVAFLRLPYPFELEWMEGGMLDHVLRVREGLPLYAPPSVRFTAFIYPPLYFYLGACLSLLLGSSLPTLRLISILATLGCLLLLFATVRRESGSRGWGVVSAGLFAATYAQSGAWFDLARVDTLYLFFFLAALYRVRFAMSIPSLLLAAPLFLFAALTKQTALIPMAACLIGAIFLHGRRALSLILVTALLTAAAFLWLDWAHQGWLSYYLLYLPSQHRLEPSILLSFWTQDLLPLFPLLGLALLGLLQLFRAKEWARLAFYALTSGGCLVAAWSSRLHTGGYVNVLMPLWLVTALLAGLALARAHQGLHLAPGLPSLLCLLQLVALVWNPAPLIPTRADLEANLQLVESIRRIPGPVWVPTRSTLTTLAGRPRMAHAMAILDVFGGDHGRPAAELDAQLRQALRERYFSAIVADSAQHLRNFGILETYQPLGPIFDREGPAWTRSGLRTRPQVVFVPKE